MGTFRRRPETLKAWEVTAELDLDLRAFVQVGSIIERGDGTLLVFSRTGATVAKIGDFVIQRPDGEIYPCPADTFAAIYEPA